MYPRQRNKGDGYRQQRMSYGRDDRGGDAGGWERQQESGRSADGWSSTDLREHEFDYQGDYNSRYHRQRENLDRGDYNYHHNGNSSDETLAEYEHSQYRSEDLDFHHGDHRRPTSRDSRYYRFSEEESYHEQFQTRTDTDIETSNSFYPEARDPQEGWPCIIAGAKSIDYNEDHNLLSSVELPPVSQWMDLEVNKEVAERLVSKHFLKPRFVQGKLIEAIRRNGDVYVQADPGSGSTTGYLVGIINKLLTVEGDVNEYCRALITVPYFLGARNVFELAKLLTEGTGINVEMLPLNARDHEVYRILSNNAIVVSTVRSAVKQVERRSFGKGFLEYLILDNANYMLSCGDHRQLLTHETMRNETGSQITIVISQLEPGSNKTISAYQRNPIKIFPGRPTISKRIQFEFTPVLGIQGMIAATCSFLLNEMMHNKNKTLVLIKDSLVREISHALTERGFNVFAYDKNTESYEKNHFIRLFENGNFDVIVSSKHFKTEPMELPQLTNIILLKFDVFSKPIEKLVEKIGKFGRGHVHTFVDVNCPSNFLSQFTLFLNSREVSVPQWIQKYVNF